jgi:hypothetical protein
VRGTARGTHDRASRPWLSGCGRHDKRHFTHASIRFGTPEADDYKKAVKHHFFYEASEHDSSQSTAAADEAETDEQAELKRGLHSLVDDAFVHMSIDPDSAAYQQVHAQLRAWTGQDAMGWKWLRNYPALCLQRINVRIKRPDPTTRLAASQYITPLCAFSQFRASHLALCAVQ